ncbi:hypothetical protein HYV43_01805 [Candidatus Micrarchaeota archaeon]|nr:hypothetical protein [Candidatus Micrarchaeota archaeon]
MGVLLDAVNDVLTPARYAVLKRFTKGFLAFVAGGALGQFLGLGDSGSAFVAAVALAADRFLQNEGVY